MSGPAAAISQLTPDPELVALALRGGEDAFAALIGRYQRGIVNYIYRMCGNYDTALELAQETFLKVHLSLGDYDTQYKFSTWIYRIAHNQTIDLLRRKQPRTVAIEAPVETDEGPRERQYATGEQSTLERMIDDEEWARIAAAIAQLPDGLRELIVLRHVNLRSYQEIARITGMPLGTVKNRIFLGRIELRKLLTGEHFNPDQKAARTRRATSATTKLKTIAARSRSR